MASKPEKQTEISSSLAHEPLFNALENLAEDEFYSELKRHVRRKRVKLSSASIPIFGVDQFEALRQAKKARYVWLRRAIVAVCATISLLAYLAFTSPKELVIRSDGSISGFFNVLREKIQGQSFWRQQLTVARLDLEWELAAPERQAEREQDLAARNRLLDQKIDDMYQRHPSLRPSPAEEYADALRDEADRIEAAELDRWLEERRVRRIAELETILELLKKR